MNKISIILPIYNAEKYISKCIESLISQTFKDIEVICINDGSKDSSLSILEEYAQKDDRIKVISQPNSGPATSRNNGLKNSSGEYIMFCDSDDWYELNMCELMYKTITGNNVDVVCCNASVIDEEENLERIEDISYYTNKYIGKKNIDNNLISNTNVMLWNKIFKRSIINKYNICFPDKYEADDDCFYMQYMSVSDNIYFLEDKLYNYLRRASSIMGLMGKKIEKSIYDRIYVSKKYYDFLNVNNLFEKRKSVFIKFLSSVGSYGNQRWNKTEIEQAKKIYNDLYGNNEEFKDYIFYKKVNILNILNIEKRCSFDKNCIFVKYVIKIKNKKIFGFKRKLNKLNK